MSGLSQLKQEHLDKLTGAGGLDTKKAITLSKYIFRAFELIETKDLSKSLLMPHFCLETTSIVNSNILLKVQLKI